MNRYDVFADVLGIPREHAEIDEDRPAGEVPPDCCVTPAPTDPTAQALAADIRAATAHGMLNTERLATALAERGWANHPGRDLVALSRWIDAGNAGRDPEAVTWGRLAKITEEAGEVVAAFIGATGQNPRKGVTHTVGDVGDELLDVAVTALAAYEHLTAHAGVAMRRLDEKIVAVATRAGVAQ